MPLNRAIPTGADAPPLDRPLPPQLDTARCRCGSGKKGGNCCLPFLRGRLPEFPVQLMRSRFTAYALGQTSYIVRTTDPNGPQWESDLEAWLAQIVQFSSATDFVGVDIEDAPTPQIDRGEVQFVARLRQSGRDVRLAERSTFVRRPRSAPGAEAETPMGPWLYHAGQPLPSA